MFSMQVLPSRLNPWIVCLRRSWTLTVIPSRATLSKPKQSRTSRSYRKMGGKLAWRWVKSTNILSIDVITSNVEIWYDMMRCIETFLDEKICVDACFKLKWPDNWLLQGWIFFFLTDHFEVSTLRHPQMLCLAVHIQQHCLSQTSISWRWTIISCANALKTTSSIKGGLHVVHLSRVIQHFLLMKHEQHPHSQNDTLAALAEAPSLDDLVWCKQEPFFYGETQHVDELSLTRIQSLFILTQSTSSFSFLCSSSFWSVFAYL